MKQFHSWFKNNFGYSRKEISGTIVLLLLLFSGFFLEHAYDYLMYASKPQAGAGDAAALEAWLAEIKWEKAAPDDEAIEPIQRLANLRAFDPNAVDGEFLKRINMPGFAASNWEKFLKGGGRFYKKTDLLRIYGLDSALYGQLEPFLEIRGYEKRAAEPAHPAEVRLASVSAAKLEINQATAADLQKVKGIGAVFSERIVKYREALGGFRSRNQLASVYGIKPEVLTELWKMFELDSTRCCRTLDLNTVSFDSLRKHPYLRYNQARALVAYREQHGPFRSWEEVAQVKIIPDSLVEQLRFYFTLEGVF